MAGGHTITLSEKGLLEETSVNSTLHAWQGVEDIVVTRLFLLIEVSSQRFHVISRRAFASVADCDAFVSEVRRYIHASRSPAVA